LIKFVFALNPILLDILSDLLSHFMVFSKEEDVYKNPKRFEVRWVFLILGVDDLYVKSFGYLAPNVSIPELLEVRILMDLRMMMGSFNHFTQFFVHADEEGVDELIKRTLTLLIDKPYSLPYIVYHQFLLLDVSFLRFKHMKDILFCELLKLLTAFLLFLCVL
jgi:hypothetical protein